MPKVSQFMTRKAAEYGLDVKASYEVVGHGVTSKRYEFYNGFLPNFEALCRDEEVARRGFQRVPGSRNQLAKI